MAWNEREFFRDSRLLRIGALLVLALGIFLMFDGGGASGPEPASEEPGRRTVEELTVHLKPRCLFGELVEETITHRVRQTDREQNLRVEKQHRFTRHPGARLLEHGDTRILDGKGEGCTVTDPYPAYSDGVLVVARCPSCDLCGGHRITWMVKLTGLADAREEWGDEYTGAVRKFSLREPGRELLFLGPPKGICGDDRGEEVLGWALEGEGKFSDGERFELAPVRAGAEARQITVRGGGVEVDVFVPAERPPAPYGTFRVSLAASMPRPSGL